MENGRELRYFKLDSLKYFGKRETKLITDSENYDMCRGFFLILILFYFKQRLAL